MTTVRTELSQLRGLAVDAGFGAGWSAVRALPEPLARRGFQFGADLAVKRDGAGVQQLRANLRRVLGNGAPASVLDEVVATSMRRYARYWLETFRLPKMDHRAIAETVDRNTTGAHFIDAARAVAAGPDRADERRSQQQGPDGRERRGRGPISRGAGIDDRIRDRFGHRRPAG